jgi:threonine dehydrogenase-like Zn-dependent dehydrogenase
MLAAVFCGPGKPLELRELAVPDPGDGEVMLRIERCGICATDLLLTEASFAMSPGFIAGHERGAIVEAVGANVSRLKVGDHVVPHSAKGCGRCDKCTAGLPYLCLRMAMNMGGFAQYMACPEHVCVKMPMTMSLADAALVEPLAVGLLGIQRNAFPVGARIAVLGAGPVGLAAIFWARRAGAGRIVALAPSRAKQRMALAMGADHFLQIGEGVVQEVAELLGGPPDVVMECAGASGAIERCVAMVKPQGTVTVYGLCAHIDPWRPAAALLKEVSLHFVVATSLQQFRIAAEVLEAGAVEPRMMVTDTISLQQLPATFEALREGAAHQCKVLVDPWRQSE